MSNSDSNQEFHEDEELARAIALSLEMFDRPRSAGKIYTKASVKRREKGRGNVSIIISL